jgi:hypothetical protein
LTSQLVQVRPEGQRGEDGQNMTARTRQLGQDSRGRKTVNRKAGTGQSDRRPVRSAEIYQSGQD